MKKTYTLLLIGIFAILLLSGCINYSQTTFYEDRIEVCQSKVIYGSESNEIPTLGEINTYDSISFSSPVPVTLPFTFSVPRCKSSDATGAVENSSMCNDCLKEGCEPVSCEGVYLPSSYRCQVVDEKYLLIISSESPVTVNGIPVTSYAVIGFSDKPTDDWGYSITPTVEVVGIPNTITIGGEGEIGIIFTSICCYDCTEKTIPQAIIYPKVDIEGFQIVGGDAIVEDGKVLSSFNIVPGTQQTKIGIENRGFFTQNTVMVRFDGLPEGITVDIQPAQQKIKAHKIGNYDATFTVDLNVPSGRYPVVMTAFSSNGTFDRVLVEVVVP